MKVCFVSYEYPPNIVGGQGEYAGQLVTGLKKRGIDVCTITSGNHVTCGQNMYKISVPDVLYWRHYFFSTKALDMIQDLNRHEKFDLIHFNGPYQMIRSIGIPTVCTFHSLYFDRTKVTLSHMKCLRLAKDLLDLVFKNSVGSFFDISMARISDKIICPGRKLAKAIQMYCLVEKQKIHVVPNGFDYEAYDRIKCSDESLLEKYAVEKENYLLYMGRLSPFKGIEYLIEAFENVRKSYASLKLVIAGSGNHGSYLRKITHDTEGVRFIGFVSSHGIKKLLYKNCLAVVVPSLHETAPLVVLEAMASGKPVVASDVGSIPSMISHGKNGFLVKPGGSKSIATFVKLLCEDSNLRKKIGMNGRKLLEKVFSVDMMVNNTLQVYEFTASGEGPT